MMAMQGRNSSVDAWKYFSKYFQGSRRVIASCVVIAFLQSLCLLPTAWLIRRAFDVAVPAQDVKGLVALGLTILGLNLLATVLALLGRFLSLRTTKRAIAAAREDLILHWFSMPREFHDTADRGKLNALIVHDTELVDVMSNALIVNFLPSLVLSCGLLVILAVLEVRLLGMFLLVAPVAYLTNHLLGKRVKLWVRNFRHAFQCFSKAVHFALRHVELTEYQSAERYELSRQKKHIERLRTDSERMAWLQNSYALLQSSSVTLMGVLLLVVGGVLVSSGTLSLGVLVSFYVVVTMLGSALQQLFNSFPHILAGQQSLVALHEFASSIAVQLYHGSLRAEFQGDIKIVSVGFSYADRPVLTDVSLHLEPGTITVVVGPNGSGKTTLARLVFGLYRPRHGSLSADGTSYDNWDMICLRSKIAFAPQTPAIFSGTVWENITYGMLEIKDDDVRRACTIALVDEFVRELPDGYATQVGENGEMLSGGQRQRLAIARALMRHPSLLLLDEPGNNMDPGAIRRFLQNLISMAERPTVLIISQEQPWIPDYLPVYQLDNGILSWHSMTDEPRCGSVVGTLMEEEEKR